MDPQALLKREIATVLLIFLGFEQGYSTQTTCFFAPTEVSEGSDAVLSCIFPIDVKTHKKHFMVQFSNDSYFAVDEGPVVDCNWSESEPYRISNICPLKGIFNKTVKLGFDKVSSANEGYYKCLVVADPTESDSEHCRLTIKAPQTREGDFSVPQTREHDVLPWVIGIVLAAGVILLVILGTVYFCKRRRAESRERQAKGNEQHAMVQTHDSERRMVQTNDSERRMVQTNDPEEQRTNDSGVDYSNLPSQKEVWEKFEQASSKGE